jgi:outer membrane protein assembly factor BamB
MALRRPFGLKISVLFTRTLACQSLLASLCLPLQGQEWTRFRGPNGSGISEAKTIPVQITEQDFNWRIALPGEGHSSPVLWGSRLFITSADERSGKRYLICIHAIDGKTLWTRSYDFKPDRRHQFNSYASYTPTVDAEAVYTIWASEESFIVTALTHAGRDIWVRNLGAYQTQHGGATSPILVGDTLILAKEQENGPGSLFGLDRKTGKTRWEVRRPSLATPYSTPIIYQPSDGPPEVIFCSTAQGVTSIHPENGKINWEAGNLFTLRCVGSPVIAKGRIIATSGEGSGRRLAVALTPGSATRNAAPKTLYRLTRGTSYVPTPIAWNDLLFFWGDGGIVTCVRADNGETVWSERVGGNFFGSPILVNGRLYAMSTHGELVVVEASERFRLLARVSLGEGSHATPAVANGSLYLRTSGHLISVGGPKTAEKKR